MDNFNYREGTDTPFAPWNDGLGANIPARECTAQEKVRNAKVLADAIAAIEARFGK